EGAVAVARDATFSSFSVGYGLSGGTALVAGRDLTLTSGTVGGDAVYGNVANVAPDVTLANGGTLSQGSPVDFATLETELVDLSVDLASLFPTDPTQVTGSGGLVLVGTDADLNVFQVTEAEIEGATSLLIQAPASSAVVVNIGGADLDFGNLQWTLSGVTAGQVIVNLFEATTADLTAVGVDGTLLAPLAHVTFSNGDLEGTLVAKQLTGGVELYDTPFVGIIDECPAEPPPAVASCEADYHIVNAWPTNSGIGYQVQVSFSHSGAPLSDWQLTWRYPGDDAVQHLWNGVHSQSGADVTVADAGWNGAVAVGQTVSLGFIAGAPGTYPTLPPTIELNGVVCD
ncbi:MAG: choice-of-anchor A family protein, partial [Myxococcota bacterium]